MDTYREKDLIDNIEFKDDFINVKNDMVNISIMCFGDELDLFSFYSKTNQKGYARCTLYYMLKWIVDNLPEYNNDTLIGILTILPSKPRRNIETIIKTYKNIGFSNITKTISQPLTDEDKKELGINDDSDIFDTFSEIASAAGEKISTIMNNLEFCEEQNKKRRKIAGSNKSKIKKSKQSTGYRKTKKNIKL